MLGWIKAWLEMAVEEDDGKGGRGRTNRARREGKRNATGRAGLVAVQQRIHATLRAGWKELGYARCFDAEIVNYADDLVACGRAPAATMREVVEAMMERLRGTDQRDEDPKYAGTGGAAGVPGVPHWTQLPPDHGASLHRHATEPEQRSERVPQDQRVDAAEVRTPGLGSGGEPPESSDGRVVRSRRRRPLSDKGPEHERCPIRPSWRRPLTALLVARLVGLYVDPRVPAAQPPVPLPSGYRAPAGVADMRFLCRHRLAAVLVDESH